MILLREVTKGDRMKTKKAILSAVILTVLAVGQIILSFVLYNETGNEMVRNLGWVILWISAIFGWLPILTFCKWGSVPEGKGYVHTTVLVDRGIYGIVRHPQYLAGILIGVGLSLVAQHWAVTALGVAVSIHYYLDTFEEERNAEKKFGEAYEAYRERVPRLNALLGLLRWLRRLK